MTFPFPKWIVACFACAAGVLVDHSIWGHGPVSRREQKELLADADWDKSAYLKKLWAMHNKTLNTYHLDHENTTVPHALQLGAVHFLGDSIARELDEAALSMGIESTYFYDPLVNDGNLKGYLNAKLEFHDTIVIHASVHYLVRRKFDDTIRKFLEGRSCRCPPGASCPKPTSCRTPILAQRERFEHVLSASGDALREAESRGFPKRTIIVCTAMPLDIDMQLSDPANYDWENFEELYLSHLWGEVDAKVAKTTCLHPRVIIAPLHRFAAQFPGIRADGMHYGSWLDDIGHFQGVYKPFIKSLLHAHHKTLIDAAVDATTACR